MRVAFGRKAHSSWAARVAIGCADNGEFQIIQRRRIELVGAAELAWAKQPYHAARAD